jgi:hypothetical protein
VERRRLDLDSRGVEEKPARERWPAPAGRSGDRIGFKRKRMTTEWAMNGLHSSLGRETIWAGVRLLSRGREEFSKKKRRPQGCLGRK